MCIRDRPVEPRPRQDWVFFGYARPPSLAVARHRGQADHAVVVLATGVRGEWLNRLFGLDGGSHNRCTSSACACWTSETPTLHAGSQRGGRPSCRDG
eukprot:15186608-Alexandrium_andersonii.AAC.1